MVASSSETSLELDFAGPAFAEAVLEAAPVIVLVLDARGRILHYNAFMERLCGRPIAEVRGLDWFEEFLLDDEREAIKNFFADSLVSGPVRAKVNAIQVRGGEQRLIEWHDRKLYRDDGSVSSVVAIGVDISEHVREANERSELAQRFELFADRVDEAFFMTDLTRTKVSYLSPAFDRITGVSRESIYSNAANLAEVLHPDDRHRFFHAFGTAIPPGQKSQVEREYRVLRPIGDGQREHELRWISVRYNEVHLRDGEGSRVVGTISDITERKQNEKEVEELGRIFALFNDAVDEVFLLLNPARDRVIFVSESIERIFGVTREAVYADIRAMGEHFHPDDRLALAQRIGKQVPTEAAYEFRVLLPEGKVRWVLSRLSVLGSDSAMPGAIVSISHDISERRESEEALHQLAEELELRVAERTRSLALERQRLQRILDGMAVFVGILDPSGQVQQINAQTRDVSSHLPGSVLGHTMDGLPGVRYSDSTLAAIQLAYEEAGHGRSHRFDLEVVTKGDTLSVTDITLNPILDDEGRVLELVSTGVDVTARRKIEARLRESLTELEIKEARLADAQRMADVGDWEWDVCANSLSWSNHIFRIFGLEVGSIEQTYEGFLAAVHEQDRAKVSAAVAHALATKEHYEIEHRIVRPDGEIRFLLENGEVTCDAQGQPLRMNGTVQDMTRQKQVEAELRASLAEKDALLHEIHHRVKNNLQVVTSLLYLKGVDARPEIREVLDECSARIRSMALIHEQLYVSGRLARIEMREFLATLGEELIRVFADDRSIRIRVQGEGLHLGIEHAVPLALLANELLTNALKYAYPDVEHDREVEIRVYVGPDSLEIADDGVGLPLEIDPAATHSLGLRLVHSLARQLDARLDFSTRGPGTRVRLRLNR